MSRQNVIFLTGLVILSFFSCNKVKLEDDERGRLLLGEWEFKYAGKFNSSGSFQNWTGIVYPYQDYRLEFNEDANLRTYGGNSSNSYDIIHTNPLDQEFSSYGFWYQQYSYENKAQEGYLRIRYYGDSIIVSHLPYDMYTTHNILGGNVFYRVQ